MATYLILLRGINVGGKNLIKMTALKSCLEKMGFSDVRTYIQSGNVLVNAPAQDPEKLATKVEVQLSKSFSYESSVVIVSSEALREIIKHAPPGFGSKPTEYRYDVLFLKAPYTAQKALQEIAIKEGVDTVHAGKMVVYFSRLISKATQSRLSRIIQKPVYKYLTIRNWNTTTKLCALLDSS